MSLATVVGGRIAHPVAIHRKRDVGRVECLISTVLCSAFLPLSRSRGIDGRNVDAEATARTNRRWSGDVADIRRIRCIDMHPCFISNTVIGYAILQLVSSVITSCKGITYLLIGQNSG